MPEETTPEAVEVIVPGDASVVVANTNYEPDIALASITEEALVALEKQYSIVPNVTTPEGMEACKAALRALKEVRLKGDAYRKDAKAPALAWCNKVQEEWNRIEPRIKSIEKRFRDAKVEEDAKKAAILKAKKEAEALRVRRIDEAVEKIKNSAIEAVGLDSAGLLSAASALQGSEITEAVFQERTHEAETIKNSVLEQINVMYKQVFAQEEEAREAAAREKELQEERRVADIQTKISAIDQFVAQATGSKTSAQVKVVLSDLAKIDPDSFQELSMEAKVKKDQVHEAIMNVYNILLDAENQRAEAARIAQEKADEEARVAAEIEDAKISDVADIEEMEAEPVTATNSDQMMSEEAYNMICELLDDDHAAHTIFEALVAGAIPHVNIEWKHNS